MNKYIYKLLRKLGFKIENIKKKRKLIIKDLNSFKVITNIELLRKSYQFVHSLKKEYPNLEIEDHSNGVIFKINKLKVYVETVEEILILNEIFVKKDYNFFTKDKIVLIDIGANIGIASLFFSLQENIKKIYAFEPVDVTFNLAIENLSRNEKISKIESIYNYGLGKNERKEVFNFNPNVKGNTGLRGDLSTSFRRDLVSEKEVIIKNASDEINKILKDNSKYKIGVKMDCEGSEYEIFESLEETGVLKNIDLFMIEWHDKGAIAIEKLLKKNNFMFFSQKFTFNSGIIYAVKQ
ncbi:FkbM family methyltransferase [Polaribacter sp. Z022]|uniref:FkbM family methyltransferase n=1 Tax=Polaribacter sp. Z022 TaxID=2927125 RepID=UPI002021501B|nr:FkbM family methyltransferase [Polaribacter sp. Z022]MCL7753185.1 FkbM family methyltransferase [Polaribacter sp. Z022]